MVFGGGDQVGEYDHILGPRSGKQHHHSDRKRHRSLQSKSERYSLQFWPRLKSACQEKGWEVRDDIEIMKGARSDGISG
jgi:hypothetical protein